MLADAFWTTGPQLNHDGTTQSLVRREKARARRRRFRLLGLLAVCFLVAGTVLAVGRGRASALPGGGASSSVTFYVVADEPRGFESYDAFTRELETLPRDAEFVVHLGSVNGGPQGRCREYGYERAASMLRESPVPVLAVPGDLDWAACGRDGGGGRGRALGLWDANFGRLADAWDHPLDVQYSRDVVGNFAFLRGSALFVSVNVAGEDTDGTERADRLAKNVDWTKGQLRKHRGEYKSVVIFGHAPPSSKQGEYFWPVAEEVESLGVPALYLHANKEGGFERYRPFARGEEGGGKAGDGLFTALQLERSGKEGPTRVSVAAGGRRKGRGGDPFRFQRRAAAEEREG